MINKFQILDYKVTYRREFKNLMLYVVGMVFNATFNNISVPAVNHRPATRSV